MAKQCSPKEPEEVSAINDLLTRNVGIRGRRYSLFKRCGRLELLKGS